MFKAFGKLTYHLTIVTLGAIIGGAIIHFTLNDRPSFLSAFVGSFDPNPDVDL